MYEPNEVEFGVQIQVGPWNHVLCGGPNPQCDGALLEVMPRLTAQSYLSQLVRVTDLPRLHSVEFSPR